jgi:hypothetical protein
MRPFGGRKPGGARGGGGCQVNAACALCESDALASARREEMTNARVAASPGRPRWRELSGERSVRDL